MAFYTKEEKESEFKCGYCGIVSKITKEDTKKTKEKTKWYGSSKRELIKKGFIFNKYKYEDYYSVSEKTFLKIKCPICKKENYRLIDKKYLGVFNNKELKDVQLSP